MTSLNTQGALPEATNTNNSFTSTQTLHVVQGFYGLAGQLTASTFPTALAANASMTGKLSVSIDNTGNLALAKGQKLTIQLVAIDQSDTSHRINIGAASTITLSALAMHATSSAFAVSRTLATGLPAGDYRLGFVVTPTTALAGVGGFVVSAKADGTFVPLAIT